MTENHPITPPPELVAAWCRETGDSEPMLPQIAAKAAQWGAEQAETNIERKLQQARDQELEACVAWLDGFDREGWAAEQLRAARRPKPPSLKEEAFAALGPEPLPETGPTKGTILNQGEIKRHRIIRRALESIPDPS